MIFSPVPADCMPNKWMHLATKFDLQHTKILAYLELVDGTACLVEWLLRPEFAERRVAVSETRLCSFVLLKGFPPLVLLHGKIRYPCSCAGVIIWIFVSRGGSRARVACINIDQRDSTTVPIVTTVTTLLTFFIFSTLF